MMCYFLMTSSGMFSGDVFLTDWDSLLDGVSVVVSTLGGIGTNEQMEKLNANANIVAVNAAKKAGEKGLVPNLGTLNRKLVFRVNEPNYSCAWDVYWYCDPSWLIFCTGSGNLTNTHCADIV